MTHVSSIGVEAMLLSLTVNPRAGRSEKNSFCEVSKVFQAAALRDSAEFTTGFGSLLAGDDRVIKGIS